MSDKCRGYGMVYEKNENGKVLPNASLFIPSEEYGIKNPLEIDILCRLSHENIISAIDILDNNKIKNCKNKVVLVVPICEYSLKDAIIGGNLGTTEKKIPIIYQMISALDFLHHNGIVHNNITTSSFYFCNNKILLGEFKNSKVIEEIYECGNGVCELKSKKAKNYFREDIKDLAKVLYYLITEKEFKNFHNDDFSGICEKYCDGVRTLIHKMLFDKITTKEILACEIFQNCPEIKGEYNRYNYEDNYDVTIHRDLIKGIVYIFQNLFPDSSMKAMFAAIDLYKRTDASFIGENLKVINAYTCLYLANKILGKDFENDPNMEIDKFLDKIDENFSYKYEKDDLINQEIDIIKVSKGCLLDLCLFTACENFEHVYETFHTIVMDKDDATLYKNIDVKDWIEKLREEYPGRHMIDATVKSFFAE